MTFAERKLDPINAMPLTHFLKATLAGAACGILVGTFHGLFTIDTYKDHPIFGITIGAIGYTVAILFLTTLKLTKKQVVEKWGNSEATRNVLFDKYFLDALMVVSAIVSIGCVLYSTFK